MKNLLFRKQLDSRQEKARLRQLLLTMKITVILSLVFMTCVHADSVAQKVSLSLKNAKLEEVFSSISKQTKYRFLYEDEVIKNAKPVNVELKGASVENALSNVLNSADYSFKIIAGTITVNKITPVASRNLDIQRPVTGTIKDENGRPLAGATVSVKGSSTSTSTNDQGYFSINAASNATLVVRFVGFNPKEISVSGRSSIEVELTGADKALEEVVITGIGSRIDKNLFTGATAKVNMKDVEIGGMADASRSLEGRIAGVTVQNTTGTFGSAPKIRVRGATSIFGSSKPLWVVDGIIIEDVSDVSSDDLSSGDALTLISSAVAGLNASDIESFTVLKDGSATSIYGARAMGGVIVITTKRGRAGYNSFNYVGEYTSRAIPSYNTFNIMNSQEQMSVYQFLQQRGWLNLSDVSVASESGVYGKMYQLINAGQLENTEAARNAYLRQAEYRNTNWFKELFSTSIMNNHSLSISSGTDKSQYYTSVSALVDPGWAKQSNFKRYTASLNASYNLLDNLKLDLLTGGSYRNQRAPGTLGQTIDVVSLNVKRDFDINPYAYALNTSRTLDPNELYTRNYAPFNILHELENNYMDINVSDVKFQGELKWKLFNKLELAALGAVRYQQTSQQHHVKDDSNQATAYRWMPNTIIRDKNPYLYTDPDNPYAVPVSILPSGGIYNRTDNKMLTNDFRFTFNYNETFNDVHKLYVFGGASVNSVERNNNWFRGWGLQYNLGEIPFTDYRIFKRGQEENSNYFSVDRTKDGGLANIRSREVAFFGQANYSYDNRYSINGTLRYEGTNRLGRSTSARWLPTWNVSGLWNVHEEQFFKDWESPINNLSFKGSYSLTADRGPAFVTNSKVIIRSYNPWRPNTADKETGLEIADLENSDLTFEKKHELNIGASLGLFNNRLAIDVDWYKRNQFDLIGIVNTQGLGGQITKYGNVAEMKSNGLEISVSGTIIKNDNFSWVSNFIYTKTKNKVTKLENNQRVLDLITGNGFALEGYPVRSLFSIPFARIQNNGLPVFGYLDNAETTTGIYFQDRDKLGFLKYEGPTEPTDLGSFGNIFSYKNFKLNVFFTYSFGNVVRLDPVYKTKYSDLTATTREFWDAWTVPGEEGRTNVPVILDNRFIRNNSQYEYAYNAYNYSTVNMASGDFVRLKDVSLSYDLPKTVANSFKLSSLGLRLNATNLWLVYADKRLNGQDPEFINSGGVALPIPRQYTLTVKLGL
ncbi:SusC/RagA family TonB-linked outer membrane protein [Sphingobacterium spiritivorum]|uniref:TonB-linked outer membrane protein, SusC/RagA family n=2 Tax=Sphingobacterium spiritivorum TaxID=258 RepID=D7VJG7_SPHSI|nr:SusC/RagA family TonB-linked outer membrane protein [Sphingobacterium spiritivorum]EFK59020.1 TonB-linked outer membrane protein, SusC/RagA family [Sphingobacterium spiritivorum ATCC 33861]QQT36879.1 SusC/RagA family TonB-linked outer membrane protein [Sphingobacterium spiritivorum]WQD33637.1 SusC/RagA family TonB-linked outer membrane protein [Sphingobacterium spiritivorum]SUJ25601.1 Outer membrane receptor for ferrienterochelin and colicins [Sphingobacterium spiritivorum]